MSAFLRGFRRGYLFGALFCLMLFMLGSLSIQAQEVTPEAPPGDTIIAPGDVVATGDDTTVVNTDAPDPLAPLLAMAGSVFAAMELLKNFFLKGITETLDERAKALVNWTAASALAFLLVLGAPAGIDIFTATDFPNPFGDLFGRIVTALAVGGGNAILHGVYEFLRTPRLATSTPLRR